VFRYGLAIRFLLLALFRRSCSAFRNPEAGLMRVRSCSDSWCWRVAQYLSNIDQVLQKIGELTSSLAAWVVLFGLAGLYLLDSCAWKGIKSDEHLASRACCWARRFSCSR